MLTFRRKPGNDNTLHMSSCMTILLINIPYFTFMIITVIVAWVHPHFVSFHVIAFAWIPIVTSGLNPGIILARKREARSALVGLFRRCLKRKSREENNQSPAQLTIASRAGQCSQVSVLQTDVLKSDVNGETRSIVTSYDTSTTGL